jgi:hypothetical protein
MRRFYDYLTSFSLGYFVGLGALALMHYFLAWPSSYEQAALLALLSGAGALGTRLYNQRIQSDDGH